MAIRVTCQKCLTRFNVSDKFAGKEGPCPKCKATIKIPLPDEQIVIHAPVDDAPKDSKGRSVLKPIARRETTLTAVHIAIISCSIVAYFAGAFLMRFMIEDKTEFPFVLLCVAAFGIAFPISFAAYTFLRDQELGGFVGKDLWLRVGACAIIYALLWFSMPLCQYAFNGYGTGAWITAVVAMLGIGGATGMLSLDLDYLLGILHYGMYLGICLLGRLIVDIGVLPGMNEIENESVNPLALLLTIL